MKLVLTREASGAVQAETTLLRVPTVSASLGAERSGFSDRDAQNIALVQNPYMLTIGTVVLGVSDFQRALDFWMNAIHYVPREEPEEDWAVLVPPEGTGTHLALGLSETLPQEYPRVHLDLYARDADEQASEVERLLSLGAERVEWDRYPDDADFVVLADPEGNRFCVVDKSHA